MTPELSHDRCSELLGPYARGELDAPAADAVRAHLEGCTECRAELAGHVAVAEATVAPMTAAERAALHEAVAARLGRPPARAADVIPFDRRRTAPSAARWLGVAAVLLVVVAAALAGPRLFTGTSDEAATTGGAESGTGGEALEAAPDIDGPTPVFAAGLEPLTLVPEQDQAEAAPRARGSLETSDSPAALRRSLARSPLLAAFRDSYTPDDASGLGGTFLDLLATDALGPVGDQISTCGAEVLTQVTSPVLPAYAARVTFNGERALMIVFVRGDGALDSYSAWLWPMGSCEPLITTVSGPLRG